MNEIISLLTDKDDKKAFEATKKIAAASEFSPEYCSYLEDFASLLSSKSSYIRTRAFILCCCQARWDTEGRLKNILPRMLTLFHNSKPTVVRQCLKAAEEIIAFRPEYGKIIEKELRSINLQAYKDSMIPLIKKDIDEVLALTDEAKTVDTEK